MASRFGLAWVAVAAAALGAAGCAPDCGEAQTIPYEHGLVDETRTFFQSTPITGPLLHFPPQREYEFVHGLVGDIIDVDISLSFQESGKPDAGLGLTPSTGNQAIYTIRPEKGFISVRNDVCAEFYVYVSARSAVLDDAGARD